MDWKQDDWWFGEDFVVLGASREWTSTGGSKRQTHLTAEESADEIDMARADSGTGRLFPLLVLCYVDVKP